MSLLPRSLKTVSLLIVALVASAAVHAGYIITPFTYPGAVDTNGWGINNSLQVAANASLSSPPDARIGFVYTYSTGTMAPLPPASGGVAQPLGINDAGVLVGNVFDTTVVPSVTGPAFILDGGGYTTFTCPGATTTWARAISNAGLVTGYNDTTGLPSAGFTFDPAGGGGCTDILIPDSFITIAQGINTAGVIVGSVSLVPGNIQGLPPGGYGFVRQPGGSIALFRVNGQSTRARDINDSGRVAGWFFDDDVVSPGIKGFVVTVPGLAPFESITIPAADYITVPGKTDTFVEGINNAGFVSGSAYDAGTVNPVGFVGAPPSAQQIADLIDLIDGMGIHHGTANSLVAKLDAAQRALARGNVRSACGSLGALINAANAQSGKKLTPSQAAQIVDAANAIRVGLGC